MNFIITTIERVYETLYAEGEPLVFQETFKYRIRFEKIIDGSLFEGTLEVEHGGDLSFEKAKELIVDKISRVTKQ